MNSAMQTILEEYSSRIESTHIFFAPNLPPKKVENARTSYAYAAKDEQLLALVDNTVFGSAKEGILLTDRSIYARGTMESPKSMRLSDIQSVTLIEGFSPKLRINDIEFLTFTIGEKESPRLFAEILGKISKLSSDREIDEASIAERDGHQETAQSRTGERSIVSLQISSDIRRILEEYSSIIVDDHIFFAPNLPPKKVGNALLSYAGAAKDEELLVLIDDTTLGSAKKGVLLTDRSIYTPSTHGGPSQHIELRTIQSVTFKKGLLSSTIRINNAKFAECTNPSKEAMRLLAEMLEKICIASDEQGLRRFSVVLLPWEEWDGFRGGHLRKFKGCANVAGAFMFAGLLGTLGGCAAIFARELDVGVMQGLGMIVFSWAPFLVWPFLTGLYRGRVESKEEEKQLEILLNDPSPGTRCNAAYRLSVIGAKGAISHLESLLKDDTIDPKLREYAEKSLAKLKEETQQSQKS